MTFGNITGFPAVWPDVDKFLPKRGYMERITVPDQHRQALADHLQAVPELAGGSGSGMDDR